MSDVADLVMRPALFGPALLLVGLMALGRAAVLRRAERLGRRSSIPLSAAAWSAVALVMLVVVGPVVDHEELRPAARNATLWIAWDVSASMGVGGATSRFEQGRRRVGEVLARLPGVRVGLAVFGSTGHVVLPPTSDSGVVTSFMSALTPGLLSDPSTSAPGVEDVLAAMGSEVEGPVSVLLVTDGEWTDGPVSAGRDGPPVHVLWTDVPAEGVVPDAGPNARSRADSAAPRALAGGSGGLFVSLSDTDAHRDLIDRLHASARAARHPPEERRPVDGTAATALLAALALAVGAAPTGRRR